MMDSSFQQTVLSKKTLMTISTPYQLHPEVREALTFLETLKPDDIHLKTNASLNQIMDFQSIWWNHTPSAARYYLLPLYWEGTLTERP